MTCILGLIDDGKMYMGADSAGVSGWDILIQKPSKIFIAGSCIIGVAGDPRALQLLRYSFKLPDHPEGMENEEYIAVLFTDAVREVMKIAGYAKKENEQEKIDSTILVAYRGELFRIESNYQFIQVTQNYFAVGGGSLESLGSMYATQDIALTPENRITRALEASEAFNMGVRAPFHIKSVGYTQKNETLN